jgi:hypothetical protein
MRNGHPRRGLPLEIRSLFAAVLAGVHENGDLLQSAGNRGTRALAGAPLPLGHAASVATFNDTACCERGQRDLGGLPLQLARL